MNISKSFIERPVMTTLVTLSLFFSGILAYFWLPVTDLPAITVPRIHVEVKYAGSSPETVLNYITLPLEKELIFIKGVREITSRSSKGHSSITLSFDFKRDMNQVVSELQQALEKAEWALPDDLEQKPDFHLSENSQDPIINLVVTSSEVSVLDLRQLVDSHILPRLERIEGVSDVATFSEKKSIWLRINPELMAARGVRFSEIIDAVKESTSNAPLGSIQTGSNRLCIEWESSFQPKDLEYVRVGKEGVLLKEIGEISEKSDLPQEERFASLSTSSAAVILQMRKASNANTIYISQEVKRVISQLEKELPKTISLNIWFDKATWIQSSLSDVKWSLGFSFFLVVLVIYWSLKRFTDSFIACIALPLSLLGTLALMYCLNFSLDILSLLALTLSCGFVVDDAIVVLENIVRYKEKGLSPKEASLQGSSQVGFTIFSITLSLVAVFIPLLFMPGVIGILFREFSYTLTIAIVVSGIISLTITPMLCSFLVGKADLQKEKTETIKALYGVTLKKVLSHPKIVVVCALFCFVSSIYLFTKLPVTLFPEEDRGFIFGCIDFPVGTTPLKMSEHQKRLEDIFKQNKYVENIISINFSEGLLFGMKLISRGERECSQNKVLAQFEKELSSSPELRASFFPLQLLNVDMDFGESGRYELIVRGTNYEDVEEATKRITEKLRETSFVTFANNSFEKESPYLSLEVDEKKAQSFGVEKQEIQNVLHQAFGKMRIGSLQKKEEREDIILELLPEFQKSLKAPQKLQCVSSDGKRSVPLSALATWKEKIGISSFRRHEGLASASIRFSLSKTLNVNDGLSLVQEEASRLLPSDAVSVMLTGSAEAVSTTVRDTLLLLLAAVGVMYVILGILYESFLYPLIILSSIPLAGLGGVLTLFIWGEPLSVFSAVGFLLLIGIVKKNGIMMVDYALELQKKGMSPSEAIVEASLVRFRPIMMTTVVAIMGALPLAIGIGESAEMLKGLGLVIVGGLLFSQILTLYVTPVLFSLCSRRMGR